jgi:thiamine-phosphate pyrophosphorylase
VKIGKLHVVTTTAVEQRFNHAELAGHAIAGGADLIVFRQQEGTIREMIEEARGARDVCRRKRVPLLIDARLDVALAVDADGLFVRLDDFPIREARKHLGPHRIIGGVAHTVQEAETVWREGADYIALGLVYAGSGKPGKGPTLETSPLAEAIRLVSIPIVGFGGIQASNVEAVLHAGAAGVLVRTAISTSHEPEAAARELRDVIDRFSGAE